MKCTNCGYENMGNAQFCPNCGAALDSRPIPLTGQVLSLLKDHLFLALCILYSVSVGCSLISAGLPLLNILMVIFLWLLFSQGRKGVVSANYIRCISGTVFASYVINWIVFCAIALCGLLFILLGSFVGAAGLWDILYSQLAPYLGSFTVFFSTAAGFSLVLIAVILFIVAIAGILFNIFGRRSIHRFVQSLYQSLERGTANVVKCHTARIWLMVFGVLNGISALSDFASRSLSSFLAEGSLAAALIIGSILVGKYFDGGR